VINLLILSLIRSKSAKQWLSSPWLLQSVRKSEWYASSFPINQSECTQQEVLSNFIYT
jgi:hypothetical protein